jgi:hypothetical protein
MRREKITLFKNCIISQHGLTTTFLKTFHSIILFASEHAFPMILHTCAIVENANVKVGTVRFSFVWLWPQGVCIRG